MEATNKQRWFMKDKLAKSFSRVTKHSSQAQGGSKVRPSLSTQNVSGGFFTDQKYYANPSSLQKVSYIAKPDSLREANGYVNGTYNGYGGDENVDMKAATYISYVRERFKLEKVDSDGRMYQEMF